MIKNRKSLYLTWDELLFPILFIVWFLFSVYYCNDINSAIENSDGKVYCLCVIGTIQFVLTLLSIKRINGTIFCLYSFFFGFLFVFSYGQFLMWTFGIHYQNEMSVSRFVRFTDKETIIRIQVVSLQLLAIFHSGVLWSKKKYYYRLQKKDILAENISILSFLALPMMIISGVICLFYSVYYFRQAAIYGYSALFETVMNPIVKYISYMFIPSIYLNLVVHRFSKAYFIPLTVIFGLYAIPLLITGDRGSWIYFLGPWLWCYIKFINRGGKIATREEKRKVVFSVILVLVIFFISSSFVSIRSEGYTALGEDAFSLDDLYTPFIKPFFEMGQTARILGIIIKDDLFHTYPFGNTYIADFLGMVLPRVKVFFGYPDFYVENWMSTTYLGMVHYGVGFSSFAEAYLNGGMWFSWIYMLIFGYFIGRLTIIKNEDVLDNPIRTYIALSTVTVLGPCVRATMDLWLREYFWGVLFILLIARLIIAFRSNRKQEFS